MILSAYTNKMGTSSLLQVCFVGIYEILLVWSSCSVLCFYVNCLECMHLECNCSSLPFWSTISFCLVCLHQFRCWIPTGKEPGFLHDYNMVLYSTFTSTMHFLCMLLGRLSTSW